MRAIRPGHHTVCMVTFISLIKIKTSNEYIQSTDPYHYQMTEMYVNGRVTALLITTPSVR